jgi:phosphotransferase system  glucose/maltose/N-acetylglucosamine-specific IIC component
LVLAGKVFRLKEETDLTSISAKLKGFRSEEEYSYGEQTLPLVREIGKLDLSSDSLSGVFSQDVAFTVAHRDGERIVVKTIEAPFLFAKVGDRIYLVVLEKKRVANNIANQLSKILFMGAGSIVEAKIAPATLRKYHEANPEDTKVIFFDGVDIPNISKLSLYGSGLADTALYSEYSSHGAIWYMVFKSRRYGIVAGVTRSAVVTSFSQIKEPEFLTFIAEEIFPLIE